MDTFKNYALAVVLAVVAVVALVVLNVAHVDTSGLQETFAVIVIPLIALLISKVNGVEKNTNGNTGRLLEELSALRSLVSRQSELLARSAPVPHDPEQVDSIPPANS
jgi:hypothetical protein